LVHDLGPVAAALAPHIKPARPGDEKAYAKWIVQLADPRYAERERATLDLEKAGELAEPALQRALASSTSAEQRRRLERLLDQVDQIVPTGDALWQLRAVAVLDARGDSESRALLKKLAGGAEGARLTIEAREALERSDSRR
jgi:hypothetical protein